MANNNKIEEIQELVQQIKNEYQEGVDYKTISSKEKYSLRHEVMWLEILSPRLKNYLRKKFSLPLSNHNYLDFFQSNINCWFHYRTEKGETDNLLYEERGGSSCRSET